MSAAVAVAAAAIRALSMLRVYGHMEMFRAIYVCSVIYMHVMPIDYSVPSNCLIHSPSARQDHISASHHHLALIFRYNPQTWGGQYLASFTPKKASVCLLRKSPIEKTERREEGEKMKRTGGRKAVLEQACPLTYGRDYW